MQLFEIIKTLLRINITKSVYFNLKVFPLKTAIYLPVLFYGRCQVYSRVRGVDIKVKPHFGMLKIGRNHSLSYGLKGSHADVTYFNLKGTMVIEGYNNEFANGCKIYIKEGGILCLTSNLLLQNRSKIHCANRIEIGNNCQFSWETQLFDTNMHYLIDTNEYITNNKGSVFIGDFCWVGNRCTIQKGANLPNYTVVASNSVVNKDFSSIPHGVLAGIPAKQISRGSKRLFDCQMEMMLDKYFQENPTKPAVKLSDINHNIH